MGENRPSSAGLRARERSHTGRSVRRSTVMDPDRRIDPADEGGEAPCAAPLFDHFGEHDDEVGNPEPRRSPVSPFDAEYEPSPWEPIAGEVARYEESGGTAASELVGDEWLVLWTLGARSGKVRKTPLVRIADGEGSYAVIGSQGGAPTNPQWVHNLRAHGVARVQDGPDVRDFAVREVDGDEKSAWWARATAVWPAYDEYQAATDRTIPLFVLDPTP